MLSIYVLTIFIKNIFLEYVTSQFPFDIEDIPLPAIYVHSDCYTFALLAGVTHEQLNKYVL